MYSAGVELRQAQCQETYSERCNQVSSKLSTLEVGKSDLPPLVPGWLGLQMSGGKPPLPYCYYSEVRKRRIAP